MAHLLDFLERNPSSSRDYDVVISPNDRGNFLEHLSDGVRLDSQPYHMTPLHHLSVVLGNGHSMCLQYIHYSRMSSIARRYGGYFPDWLGTVLGTLRALNQSSRTVSGMPRLVVGIFRTPALSYIYIPGLSWDF